MNKGNLKWEYKCIKGKLAPLPEAFNKYGEEGWELVSINLFPSTSTNDYVTTPLFDFNSHMGNEYCIAIFKRQKKE